MALGPKCSTFGFQSRAGEGGQRSEWQAGWVCRGAWRVAMQRVDSTNGGSEIERRIGEYLRKVLVAAAHSHDLSGYNECVPTHTSPR